MILCSGDAADILFHCASKRAIYRQDFRQQKAPGIGPGLMGVKLIGRLPTLPHTCACSTIGAEGLNYRVRDGNGWDPLARVTQSWDRLNILTGQTLSLRKNSVYYSKFYGQAERAISNGQL